MPPTGPTTSGRSGRGRRSPPPRSSPWRRSSNGTSTSRWPSGASSPRPSSWRRRRSRSGSRTGALSGSGSTPTMWNCWRSSTTPPWGFSPRDPSSWGTDCGSFLHYTECKSPISFCRFFNYPGHPGLSSAPSVVPNMLPPAPSTSVVPHVRHNYVSFPEQHQSESSPIMQLQNFGRHFENSWSNLIFIIIYQRFFNIICNVDFVLRCNFIDK